MIYTESLGIAVHPPQLTLAYMRSTLTGQRLVTHDTVAYDAGEGHDQTAHNIENQVTQFKRRHGIHAATLFMGLPPGKNIVRLIQLPAVVKENLHQTLVYELKKYLPVSVDDIHFDYKLLSENKQTRQLEILLAAARKDDLSDTIVSGPDAANGWCGVESVSTAWINALSWLAPLKAASDYLAALISREICRLSLMSGGRLKGFQTIYLSGDTSVRADKIMQAADQLRQRITWENGSTKMFCFGLEVNDDLLSRMQTAGQWEINAQDVAPGRRGNEHLMAAIGLALKGLGAATLDINFLPKSRRKKPPGTGKRLLVGLALLVLLCAGSWLISVLYLQRSTLAALDQRLKQLSGEVRAIEQLQADITTLENRITALRHLRTPHDNSILAILKELSQTIPPSAWVRDLSIAKGRVRLDGIAEDSARLIPLLDRSPLFVHVVFLSTITKGNDGKERYRIGMDLEMAGAAPAENETVQTGPKPAPFFK